MSQDRQDRKANIIADISKPLLSDVAQLDDNIVEHKEAKAINVATRTDNTQQITDRQGTSCCMSKYGCLIFGLFGIAGGGLMVHFGNTGLEQIIGAIFILVGILTVAFNVGAKSACCQTSTTDEDTSYSGPGLTASNIAQD